MSSDTGPATGRGTTGMRYQMPAPTGAVWLGLAWPALIGLGLTVGLGVLLAMAGSGLWLSVPVAVLGAAVSLGRAGGRPLLAWVAPSSAHLFQRARGAGPYVHARVTHAQRPVRVAPGLTQRPVHLLPLWRDDGESLGVLQQGRGPDHTVVLEVISTGRFGLLDPTAQDTEIARWGTALTGLLSDPAIRSVQWLTHTRPDTRSSMTACSASADSVGGELQADYADLLHAVRGQAVQHRHLLCLTLRSASSARMDTAILVDAARLAATSLLSADLLARPLSHAELGTTLRLLLDPSLEDCGTREDARSWSHLATREHWAHCRTDDTVHCAFAVAGWPRLELTSDWLAPLLHDNPPPETARTLAVHVQPVPPAAAARRARATVAKAGLDGHDRARLGFTPAATDTLAAQEATATEAELLAGYRMTDLAAVLAVTAPDLDRLQKACRQLQSTATSQHLDLRVLHGQHRHALGAMLPLGLHPGGHA